MPTTSGTRTSTRPARNRAERTLIAQRLQAPATRANTARNARAELDRHRRWAPARDALWRLLDTRLTAGARVAIVGAGNGDTIPLDRIADRAAEVALIDLDRPAIHAARGHVPRGRRRRITGIHGWQRNSARIACGAWIGALRHLACTRRRSPFTQSTGSLHSSFMALIDTRGKPYG
jgi:hypothetical protein